MKRVLVEETIQKKAGEEVLLKGWVDSQRNHGKVSFIDLKDRTGTVQCVITNEQPAIFETAVKARLESAIQVIGKIKERPENLINEKIGTGKIEIEVTDFEILSQAQELPLDVSQEELDVSLQTLLEKRNVALKNKKIKSIFKVFSAVLEGYRSAMRRAGFLEIKTPKILSAVTEGGANFFQLEYFDQKAYLAQSPQFYKQMGVGAFERVFEVGPVFRAEPHFTSRHVNEYISLDAEMGFIENYEEIMEQLELTFWELIDFVKKEAEKEVTEYGINLPKKKEIPRIKLADALEILKKEFDKDSTETKDIDPEGEKLICEYAKMKYDCDLVFLTHYPTVARPAYAMPAKENPEETDSFDLLFRGVEIATGGQRIHHHQQLLESLKKRKMDPKNFEHYLEIFKYGMPPHGGWGMGSERIVQKLLGLKSVKEAILYPRDVKRIVP